MISPPLWIQFFLESYTGSFVKLKWLLLITRKKNKFRKSDQAMMGNCNQMRFEIHALAGRAKLKNGKKLQADLEKKYAFH